MSWCNTNLFPLITFVIFGSGTTPFGFGVFTCVFIQLLMLTIDICVCTVPKAIAYSYEKGIEVDGGVMGSAMDCSVLRVAIFGAVLGQVVWYLKNLCSDWLYV